MFALSAPMRTALMGDNFGAGDKFSSCSCSFPHSAGHSVVVLLLADLHATHAQHHPSPIDGPALSAALVDHDRAASCVAVQCCTPAGQMA